MDMISTATLANTVAILFSPGEKNTEKKENILNKLYRLYLELLV